MWSSKAAPPKARAPPAAATLAEQIEAKRQCLRRERDSADELDARAHALCSEAEAITARHLAPPRRPAPRGAEPPRARDAAALGVCAGAV